MTLPNGDIVNGIIRISDHSIDLGTFSEKNKNINFGISVVVDEEKRVNKDKPICDGRIIHIAEYILEKGLEKKENNLKWISTMLDEIIKNGWNNSLNMANIKPTEKTNGEKILGLENKMSKKIILTESQIKCLISEMSKEEIDNEAEKTEKNPSDNKKKAGNYKMGHVRVKGFPISIESPRGGYRRGKDGNGKEWKILMKDHYGYFGGTNGQGKDGDAVDVFIGRHPETFNTVYVVDQKINGEFDESKVMFGYLSEEEAKKAYNRNYSKDWKGFWKITGVSIDFFRKWLYDDKRQRKPFFEYVDVKNNKARD